MRFERLTVEGTFYKKRSDGRRRLHARCVCDCGNKTTPAMKDLKKGKVRSCGCLQREKASKIGLSKATHRMTKTSEYSVWAGMKNRCYNKNDPAYNRYGGRGITVCDEWVNSFESFYSDMGCKPEKSLSLDRIDNDSGYSKDNCRWATRVEQSNNRRSNKKLSYKGVSMTVAEWARHLNVSPYPIYKRLSQGSPARDALSPLPHLRRDD